MPQLLLFPDPRPLVDRLGACFFRQAPEGPGVYLMRDAADAVLYVGKAKNLRRRLTSYRVANPDRLPRRHLKLLRAVVRIELETCADEASALLREAELLRTLRPRFNRAGTWPGPARYLAWKTTSDHLELAVLGTEEPGWFCYGPAGTGVVSLRAALVRLMWCVLQPHRGLAQVQHGWLKGPEHAVATIPLGDPGAVQLDDVRNCLKTLFDGQTTAFIDWIEHRASQRSHPFELTVRELDLESVRQFIDRRRNGR